MPVELTINGGDPSASTSLERAAEFLLEELRRSRDELVVCLVDDTAMRDLNRYYCSRDRATDVLAFAQLDGERLAAEPTTLLGDVVISTETACRQAAEGGWSVEEEINRLLVHGILHLLGFDHERGGAEEARMREEEARLVSRLRCRGLPCAGREVS